MEIPNFHMPSRLSSSCRSATKISKKSCGTTAPSFIGSAIELLGLANPKLNFFILAQRYHVSNRAGLTEAFWPARFGLINMFDTNQSYGNGPILRRVSG